MRQVMSHRNNIGLRRIKCKKYFKSRWTNGLQVRQTLSNQGAPSALTIRVRNAKAANKSAH
jgi:hypothetical protein